MSKITGYAALSSVASDDVLVVVDVHDTSMAASGTDKKMTLAQAAAVGGTLAGYSAPAVAALTYGTTISVNAALGNVFTLTLTASTGTIANPSNPVDGQVIRFRIAQDATGGWTVAWGTAYDWGSTGGLANSAPVLTTAPSKTDVVGFEYNAALSAWMHLGAPFPQGF